MESWDIFKCNPISKPVTSDPTYFAWCPGWEHVFTAMHAPSLCVNNGYKFGIMPALSWQPFLDGLFPAKTIAYQAVLREVPG